MTDVDRMGNIRHWDAPDDDPFGCLCDICNQEAIDRAFSERESLRERVRLLDSQLTGAVDALAAIHDKAKYLAEGAWNAEGTRLVGEHIMRVASPHLGGQ